VVQDLSMAQRVAKRWSINAVSNAEKPPSFFREGFPLVPGATDTAGVSPVEYLLVAAAACFALSVRSVVAARGLPKTPFEVIATGEKARDLPSRLGQISLVVVFDGAVDETHAAAIAAEAKRLCTVTNTLVGTPALDVGARRATALPSLA
jgi:uncharacterized OsmC-like protein